MCVVSAVHDYFGKHGDLWPTTPGIYPYNPVSPHAVPQATPYGGIPQPQWDRSTFDQYKDILKRLDELDRKLGQAECVDPNKEAYMQEIERRLKALEDKA